jgi:hypothetical protein
MRSSLASTAVFDNSLRGAARPAARAIAEHAVAVEPIVDEDVEVADARDSSGELLRHVLQYAAR